MSLFDSSSARPLGLTEGSLNQGDVRTRASLNAFQGVGAGTRKRDSDWECIHMGKRSGIAWTTLVAAVVFAAVLAGPSVVYAADNSSCLGCHEGPVGSVPAQAFDVGSVDRDTACGACHTAGMVGTHPYHQAGANCGAYCHPGWGESLLTATPGYTDPISGATFASATSKNSPASVIHIIHSRARWPKDVDTTDSRCASCHSVAACSACHETVPTVRHAGHSSTTQSVWSGTTGHGVVAGDQSVYSAAPDSNLCATAGCHNLAGTQNNRPLSRENFSHPAAGGLPANTVTLAPSSSAWRERYGPLYSLGRMSYSNVANATHTTTFDGQHFQLVADKDPYRGICEVWLDGAKVATVDLYAPTTTNQAVVYDSATLAAGTHTVMVKVTGTKNPASRYTYVTMDALKVYASLPDSIAPSCLESACHADKSSGHGGNFDHEATQTAGLYPTGRFGCTDCHSLGMWTEHGRTSSKTDAAGCGACHPVYADYTLDEFANPASTGYGSCTWAGDGSVTGCHQVAQSEQPHNFVDSDHDASGVAATADCRACHGNDLSVIHDDTNAARPLHASLVGTGSVGPDYQTDCLTCHGPNRFPATKDCTDSGCHTGSGVVDMVSHPAPPHNGSNTNVSVPRTGGELCSTCHILELTSEHGKPSSVTDPGAGAIGCANCHTAGYFPDGWLTVPNNTCQACHVVGSGAPGAATAGEPHESADYAAKHDWSARATGCGGMQCHYVSMVDTIHDPSQPYDSSCQSCHTDPGVVPTADTCTDCHSAHPYDGDVHDPVGTPARATANADCLTCHTEQSASVSANHPGGCFGCHNNSKLTKYLQDNYDLVCTDCHNASMEIGWGQIKPYYDYTFSSKTPTYESAHYDTYAANHTATGMGTAIANKTCSSCHATTLKVEHLFTLSAGSVECFECHTMSAPIDAKSVIAADWTNDACADCHGSNHGAAGLGVHDLSVSATSLGCSDGGCHDANTGDVATLHLAAVDGSANTSCNVCHTNADTDLSTITGCDSCHAGHDMTVHAVSTDTGNCLRCHDEGAPANDLRGLHPSCATCHDNATYPGLITGKTSDCVDCHNATLVDQPHTGGGYDPYDSNHYTGTETTHTASGAQAATLYDGFACSACHKTEMRPEHFKASSAFPDTPGTYADKCVDCHESEVDGFGAAWNDTCAACHATNHTDRAVKHDATGIGNADSCDGSGCHIITDVAALHSNSATNSTTTADTNTCATCHVDNNAVPTSLGCNSSGCHGASTPSSHQHALDKAGSDYSNASETGCSSSGAGCHVQTSTGYLNYHTPSATCLSSTCHTSADHWDPTYDNPNTCQNCHSGLYQNASDANGLKDIRPAGHYDTTLHTAGGLVTTVTVGGTTSAACTVCHANGTGTTGLYNQHQGLQTLGTTTCSDCHNANVGVTLEVTSDWTTNTCADCHNATDLPLYAQHGTTIGAATGSSADGCVASGCHVSDLHSIHKGDGVGGDPACTVCHDNTKQGWNPTDTTCGASGACHTSGYHADFATAHTAVASSECVQCHESANLGTVHASNCSLCHGNATYPSLPGTSAECVDCHKAGLVAEPHNDPNGNYSPYDANHYNGTETTHTADGADTGYSNTDGNSCVSCHLLEMKPEHFKGSSAFASVPGTHADKCVACHEINVDGFAGAWTDRCVACHTTGSSHTGFDTVHNASASYDTSCGGGGCHDTDNVDLIHKNSVTTNPTVTTCLNTCHDTNTAVPASVNCDTSGCHAGGHGHELDLANSNYNNTTIAGCTNSGSGCHGTSAGTDYQVYHPASGCVTGACHTAANKDNAQFDNPNTCQNCHGGGALLFSGAPDAVGLADTAGHYNETTHTATGQSTQVKGTTNGTASALCSDCHNGVSAGIDGLYPQHQGVRTGSLTCSDCHNKNAAIQGIVTDATRTDTCAACHNGTIVEAQHSSSNAPVVTGTGVGCQTTGCHTTSDLHTLHKDAAGGCNLSGCHDYTKQGIKPTSTTCGTAQACHNASPTHPGEDAAHDATSKDVAGCIRCHEVTDIRTQHSDDCSICHNAGANLGGTVGITANCVDCHDGYTANGDVYYNPADTPDYQYHYNYYASSHTESANISGTNWGTTSYGVTLDRFFTGGTTADTTGHGYEVACSACHTTDMMVEHTKTTVGFSTVPGTYADVCVACHEIKVDAFVSPWGGGCGGEGSSCHSMASGANGLHRTTGSGWDQKHNASSWPLNTPGSASTAVIGGGGPTPAGGGALGAGFSNGFETNDFAAWTSVDQSGAGGTATIFSDTFESGNLNAWTSKDTDWNASNNTGNGGAHGGSWFAEGVNTSSSGTITDYYLTKNVDLSSLSGAATLTWWQNWGGCETSDFIWVEYYSGGTWTQAYTLTGATLDLEWPGWTTQSISVPQSATAIRWHYQMNFNTDIYRLDDVTLTGPLPASPGGWSVQSTEKSAGTYAARAVGTGPQWYNLTKTGIDNSNADSVDVSYAIRWDTLEAADDVVVQYTTNNGGAWTDIKNYAPAGADPASQTWKTETFTGLPAGINGVRFRFYADNSTADLLYIDAVTVTPQSSSGGQTSVSCQNNPNGTECHNVSDVADIHSDISGRTDDGCGICHTGTAQHPTTKNCQSSGCHPGINIDAHNNRHDTNFVSASFDTAFSRSWCEACHIGAGGTAGVDGIDDEHEVLDVYHNTPCSMCHKKQSDTGGAAAVTRANTINAITTRGAGAAVCDDCHKTFTKERPHVQRATVLDNTTDTGKQFTASTAMNGHRVYASNTRSPQWMILGTMQWEGYTLGTPTQSRWLAGVSPWNTTNSMVTCADCHSDASIPTAPHAGTMNINIDPNYTTAFGSVLMNRSFSTGMTGGALCSKCHDLYDGAGWSNNVHSEHEGRGTNGGYCTHCHAQKPHQTTHVRMLGLIGEGAAGLRSGGLTGIRPHSETPTGWSTGDCGAACDTSRHPYSGTDW